MENAITPLVRSRLWCLVLAIVVVVMAIGTANSVTSAQDGKYAPYEESAVGSEGRPVEAPKLQESFLSWMVKSSGIVGFFILLVSFAMIAIICMVALQLRRDAYLPSAFIEEFEQQLQAKEYQQAYDTAKSSDSFIGRILAAGMGRLSRGYDEAVEQMQQVGEDETMAMEHKIGYLALIGSIAPMLGLLGTVVGMVLSFQVIATESASPRPSDLAYGIAMALFTTLEGLVVAIPAMIFYSLYKNRLARLLMESGFVAENLMKNFQGMSKPSVLVSQPGGSVTGEELSPQRDEQRSA